MAALDEALIPSEDDIRDRFVFYELDATLDIPRSTAEGYVILLAGGKVNKLRTEGNSNNISNNISNNTIGESDDEVTLAYAAITEGNVIDACFGINPLGGVKFGGSSYAVKSASKTKSIIRDTVLDASSEVMVKKATINSYLKCFEIMIQYHDEISAHTFLSWCWRSKQIRKKTQKRLEDCFAGLYVIYDTVKTESSG